jgi:hypothetical protein
VGGFLACGVARRKDGEGRKGKQFFFEKKNQKTFICSGGNVLAILNWLVDAISKSFLLLFFKKEELPF